MSQKKEPDTSSHEKSHEEEHALAAAVTELPVPNAILKKQKTTHHDKKKTGEKTSDTASETTSGETSESGSGGSVKSPTGGHSAVAVPKHLAISDAKREIKYVACMALSGVGDALGYKNGSWEFNRSGADIISQMLKITNGAGPLALIPAHPKWRLSDDTIMHIATAKGLIVAPPKGVDDSFAVRCQLIAAAYSECMEDMSGRAPGGMTCSSMSQIQSDGSGWDKIPYSNYGGGCGAAMRSMCIGLAFPDPISNPEHLRAIVSFGIEAGRITHHNPNGYLGSVAGALFTALAVDGQTPLTEWGFKLLCALHECEEFMAASGRQSERNIENQYFRNAWVLYLTGRGLVRPPTPAELENPNIVVAAGPNGANPVVSTHAARAVFPAEYEPTDRDAFYRSVSFDGWGGSSGHDAPMIAYDSLLSAMRWLKPEKPEKAADAAPAAAASDSKQPKSFGSGGASGGGDLLSPVYEQVILHGVLHGGDSDSTGCMALAWWGALYGFEGVPKQQYVSLEYYEQLVGLGQQMFQVAKQNKLKPALYQNWPNQQKTATAAAAAAASNADSAAAAAAKK